MNKVLTVGAAVAIAAGAVFAGRHAGPYDPQVTARQGLMALYGHNVYYLLGVAGGKEEYSAEAAQAAADSLVALTQVNQMRMWPQGSDSDSIDGTRAVAAIWGNYGDVIGKATAVVEAAAQLQAVAGNGVDEMGAAAKAVNDACNACHKDYRTQSN